VDGLPLRIGSLRDAPAPPRADGRQVHPATAHGATSGPASVRAPSVRMGTAPRVPGAACLPGVAPWSRTRPRMARGAFGLPATESVWQACPRTSCGSDMTRRWTSPALDDVWTTDSQHLSKPLSERRRADRRRTNTGRLMSVRCAYRKSWCAGPATHSPFGSPSGDPTPGSDRKFEVVRSDSSRHAECVASRPASRSPPSCSGAP